MKWQIFILIFTVLLSEKSLADNKIKSQMTRAYDAYLELLPFALDSLKFQDQNLKPKIQSEISRLRSAFSALEGHAQFEETGYYSSFQAIKSHLRETDLAFQFGNPNFARSRLLTTSHLCMSCHVRVASPSTLALRKKAESTTLLSLRESSDRAELFYLLRRYPQAVKELEKSLDLQLAKRKQFQELGPEKASLIDKPLIKLFRRFMAIHLQINGDLAAMEALLIKTGKNAAVTGSLKVYIEENLKNLKRVRSMKMSESTKGIKAWRSYLSESLRPYLADIGEKWSGNDDVELFYHLGKVQKFLQANRKARFSSAILLQLSKLERLTPYTILFGLADLFLKECIERGKDKGIAYQCYQEYEEQIILGYTGSAGTSIPKEEKAELNRLFSKISVEGKKQASELK